MPHHRGSSHALEVRRIMQQHNSHTPRKGPGADGNGNWNDFYVYSNELGLSIAAGATTNEVIQIEADSEFNLMRLAAYAEAAGENFPYNQNQQPQLALQLQDGATSRSLFSSPVPLGLVTGVGQLPFVLPVRRIFPPNGTINLVLNNYGAVQYNNIVIALIGTKVFENKPS
jgi:hypothetical protein